MERIRERVCVCVCVSCVYCVCVSDQVYEHIITLGPKLRHVEVEGRLTIPTSTHALVPWPWENLSAKWLCAETLLKLPMPVPLGQRRVVRGKLELDLTIEQVSRNIYTHRHTHTHTHMLVFNQQGRLLMLRSPPDLPRLFILPKKGLWSMAPRIRSTCGLWSLGACHECTNSLYPHLHVCIAGGFRRGRTACRQDAWCASDKHRRQTP